jgi:hypothetical protein
LHSSFPIENGLKQADALSLLLFNFDVEYAIRKVRKLMGLDMSGTPQLLAYADNVNLICDGMNYRKKQRCLIKYL